MARYIDAGEFFQTLGFYEQSFDENRDFSARQTILQIMHELEHAPTADVAEVVRCKDCKCCELCYPAKAIGEDALESWYCKIRNKHMRPDDFCSYGEKKSRE